MKKLFLFCSLFLVIHVRAQLSIGSGGISIEAGSTFSAEGLTLVPQGSLTLSNQTFQKSTTPVQIGGSVYSLSNVINLGSPFTFSGTVRLYYSSAELNGNSESQLKMAYRSTGAWSPSSASAVNAAGQYVEETVTSKTFDAFTASASYSTLPVSLLSFTAKLQAEAKVLLQWSTASEQQNGYFLVERSGDGVRYQAIGTVPASTRAYGPFAYSLVDATPLAATNYYRLKQYDRNGQMQVYGVRLVKTGNAVLSLFPNPVTGGFKVDLQTNPAKPVSYCIQNAAGQIVQSGILTGREQWLATVQLPAGVYQLSLENGQSARFIKR